MKRTIALLLALALTASPTLAQSPDGGMGMHKSGGLSQQEIKALEGGMGMGMAMIAETNQYPGPKHVLELADELELTDEQRAATQQLYGEVRSKAVPLGRQIIEAEAALERAFVEKTVDAASLEAAVLEIGALRARLRLAHLGAHLRQRAVLSEDQVATYAKLRAAQRGGGGHGMHGEGHGKMKGKRHGEGQAGCEKPCAKQ